jgi:glycosyltransferase involved in cell wall biosynthesis
MAATDRPTAVWITWESQPRNRSMARTLGVPLYEFCFTGARARRHLKAIAATLRLLLRDRPTVVFASNPSLVLTYVMLACRLVLGFRFVSDAHYGGVVAVTGSALLQRFLDFANRRADFVILTTAGHADRVRRLGGRPLVCPDPLPGIRADGAKPPDMAGAEKSALLVCTYEIDEPYAAAFEAARALVVHGFTVFASGSYARVGLAPEAVPHVRLLGFVDRPLYEAYLRHADVVLDFTTWEDCLVCGAYEAMAAGRPCVLSRTAALTELFTHGTEFTSHEPADIVQAVLAAYDRRNALMAQIPDWVRAHETAVRGRAADIRAAVGLPPVP